MNKYFLVKLFWIFVLYQFSTASSASSPITVIRAGHLIDVEHGRVLDHQLIFISEGKITGVSGQTPIPANTNVIDLSNMTVLPGLIDCHTHIVGDVADLDPLTELSKTAAQRAFESIPNARAILMAGFTSVRDLGSYRALVNVALRDAINRGDVVGPRMYVAGGYLTITGGGGSINGVAPDVVLPWDLKFGIADGVEQVRQRVRDFEKYNVDLIKVIATGAIFSHNSMPSANDFTFDEIRTAVLEAQKKGLRVAAHAHGTAGIKDAIRAGVASIEHGSLLDDEAIMMMKKQGTYLVADIYNDDCIMSSENNRSVPREFMAKESSIRLAQRENFKKAALAGVNIAFGTDSFLCPHGINAKQFAYQVKYGQTPMQAIQSATINAATLIGKPEAIGSIKPGKSADIIAVYGDPIKDIRALENVGFVMKDGKIYKQELQSGSNVPRSR